eukprot:15251829-Alexandrium_andersonii.AAC.1
MHARSLSRPCRRSFHSLTPLDGAQSGRSLLSKSAGHPANAVSPASAVPQLSPTWGFSCTCCVTQVATSGSSLPGHSFLSQGSLTPTASAGREA